jgi:uncharacterized membrane protein YjgN (DUF898 family)
MGEGTWPGKIVAWIILGILAVFAFKLLIGLVSAAFGLVGFLLFTVAPLVLLGWLAMKAWRAFTRSEA